MSAYNVYYGGMVKCLHVQQCSDHEIISLNNYPNEHRPPGASRIAW